MSLTSTGGIIVVEQKNPNAGGTMNNNNSKPQTLQTCQLMYYETEDSGSKRRHHSQPQQRTANVTQPVNIKNHQVVLSNSASTLANHQSYSQMSQNHHVLHTTTGHHHSSVIVSDEYIEQAAAAGANVINISSNDLINSSQLLKLVTDSNNGNVLIDTIGNGSSNMQNSKVLVGNLTVMPKTSFMNSKSVPYLTQTQAKQQTVQKMINMKTNNVVKTSNHHLGNASAVLAGQNVVQKVTVPRSVQLVTRLPQQPAPQQQLTSQQQIVMQQKYVQNVVAGTKINSNTNINNIVKKQPTNHQTKQKLISNQVQQQTQQPQPVNVKTFIQQQPSQQQQTQHFQTVTLPAATKVKSQKIIKQYNNVASSNATGMAGIQQQQPTQQHAGTYTINTAKLNTMPLQQSQQQPPKITKHAKYVMHHNQIVMPSQNQPNKMNNVMHSQQLLSNNTTTTISSSTIKFVNTHGTVIQQQQAPSPAKVRTSHVIQQGHHQNFTEIGKNEAGNNVYHISTSYIQQQPQPTITEDTMLVNGIPMTDEVSARILQSMAQKSYGNQRYQQQPQPATSQKLMQKPVSVSMPPPPPAQVQSMPKEYPIFNPNNVHGHQQHHRQSHSTPSSRAQSLERKMHDMNPKKSSEYFKVNSNEILQQSYHSSSSSSTTLIDNIPLPTYPTQRSDGKKGSQASAPEPEEENFGEEIRPTPVNTMDTRLQMLHAVMQDHTYVAACPSRLPVDASQPVSAASMVQTVQPPQIVQPNVLPMPIAVPIPKAVPILANGQIGNQGSYTMFGQQIPRPQQDDDANSVISNGSRSGALDNDLGEETETAPEAEAEDDSITRCICDLTHDDGYMICCDKCLAWQHVDCMGIDRDNIPEEYLCEICQPRPVDKSRAKSLQLIKRKEILLNAQLNATGTSNTLLPPTGLPAPPLVMPPTAAAAAATKKGKLKLRKDLIKKSSVLGKKEKTLGKRREAKKPTKRKAKTGGDSSDRFANTLRTWIENYEDAVTNHYSPELRARLHAIAKQPALLQSITSTENKALKNCGSLEMNSTAIPHAGGKILISNSDVEPNRPIMELRGKFLLTTQFKNQNPSVNIPSTSNSNLMQSPKIHKNAGPFVFFYQLPGSEVPVMPGVEICVDTRTYGSQARFVRRSCRPNAVVQHSFEKGTVHLYLVSLTKIMASTEITIKHEPHDLFALENKKVFNYAIQPTSTTCACGLTKDCLFGVPPAPQPPSAQQKSGARNKNLHNGALSNKLATVQKKKNANMNRNRSTSSSGESNTGILSPNNIINNNNTISSTTTSIYNSTTSIVSLMHDSGVYTSSSSPSVSIPSPTHTQAISSPPQQAQQSQQAPPPVKEVPPMIEEIQSPKLVTHTEIAPEKEEPAPLPMQSPKPLEMPPHEVDLQQEEKTEKALLQFQQEEMSVSAQMCQEILHCKFPTEEQLETQFGQLHHHQQMKSPQRHQMIAKKSPSKQPRVSMSEDSNSQQAMSSPIAEEVSSSSAPPTKPSSGPKRDSRKMTREERKMEAIVKAFEKMEKNQQRKQELKQSKCPSSASKRRGSSSPSPKRVKLLSTSDNDHSPEIFGQQINNNNNKKSSSAKKKKRKAQKAYNVPNTQRKRRKSRMNSNESDAMTSEESTSLLSPPINVYRECLPPGMPSQQAIAERQLTLMNMMESSEANHVNQAAGLLLAFAKSEPVVESEVACLNSPVRADKSMINNVMPPTPPAIVSSTCLLVEAAVGPLEGLDNLNNGEFKLPAATKTKKTLMSNWLNQSGDYQFGGEVAEQPEVPKSPVKGIDSLVQATMCDYRKSTLSPSFMSCEEPENVSIMAKKVEEFIHLSTPTAEEETKTAPLPVAPTVTVNNSISSCSNNSSVKKRWLRQAISEETDDTQLTPTPAASPTLLSNGFTTPLKKRRLLIEQEDSMNNAQELSLSKSGSDSSLSNEATSAVVVKDEEMKEEIKNEMTDMEDDVDILRSPSPGQKIVVEDNQVKIEPEDISAADVNIDVEREESNGENVEVKVEEIKVEVEAEVVTLVFPPVLVEEKPKLEVDVKPEPVEVAVAVPEPPKQEDCKKKIKTESKKSQSAPIKKSVKSENVDRENSKGAADEIADIQKRLHSFHTENIMILQSRNKASKTPRHSSSDSKPDEKKARKDKTKTSTKSDDTASKKSKSHKKVEKEKTKHRSSSKKDVVKDKKKSDKSDGKRKKDSSSSSSQKTKEVVEKVEVVPKLDERHIQAALTIPTFNQPVIQPTPTIENFLLAPSPVLPTPPAAAIHSLPTLTPPTPSTPTEPSRLQLPFYNTIYGKATISTPPVELVRQPATTPSTPTPPPTSNALLSEYLDTKAKSFGTLGGYVAHSTMFAFNTINKSPENAVNAVVTPTEVSPTTATTPSKILTKTASSDPRLNPILTAPEPSPTPKRKLSINEYRKRKLQSTETSQSSPSSSGEPTAKSSLFGNSIGKSSSALSSQFGDSLEKLCDVDSMSCKIDDTSNVQFSPAPTLLEKQQENLSERLKTLKNISSLGMASSLSSVRGDHLESSSEVSPSLASYNFNLINDNATNNLRKPSYDYDNNLEAISSSSTSPASSRASTPDRSMTPIPPAECSPLTKETKPKPNSLREESHMHDSISSNEDDSLLASDQAQHNE